jgi:hypothetical protein
LNEIQVAKAFSKQSVLFDGIYSGDTIIQYKRDRVRAHVKRFLQPASHILELNAGTGEDAIFFAGEGIPFMQQIFQRACRKYYKKKCSAKVWQTGSLMKHAVLLHWKTLFPKGHTIIFFQISPD